VNVTTSLSIKESKHRALLYDRVVLRMSYLPCQYKPVNTRSCRLPLRIAIELLSSKVDQLCCFIRDNGLQLPPMSQEKDSVLTNILEMLGLTELNSTLAQHDSYRTKGSSVANSDADLRFIVSPPIPVGTTPANQSERVELQPFGKLPEGRCTETVQSQTLSSLSTTVYDEVPTVPLGADQRTQENSPRSILDWDTGLGTCISPNPSDIHCFFDSASPNYTHGTTFEEIPGTALSPVLSDNNSTLVEETSGAEGIDGLIDELSDRVGTLRIGPGGQTHFCGPTSNFNLPDMPNPDTFETHRKAKNDALQCLDRLGGDREVPASLEEHLINLYFSWQNPFFHVVDRKIYEEAKAKSLGMEDTTFYSEALRNSM
jgi:hypothetical protein